MDDDATQQNENQLRPMGVFLTKGMSISIPEFAIQISDDGKLKLDGIRFQVEVDQTPYWLEIALTHLVTAEEAHERFLDAHRRGQDEEKADALRRESMAGMQAITASAIALDAFHTAVKSRIAIPQNQTDAWRRNKTARHKQVAEVLRRGFKIDATRAEVLRSVLRDVSYLRDKAVHPPAGASDPMLHPDLKVGAEWRFVMFRCEIARKCSLSALRIVYHYASSDSEPRAEALGKYCTSLTKHVEPLVKQWEETYGPLHDEPRRVAHDDTG